MSRHISIGWIMMNVQRLLKKLIVFTVAVCFVMGAIFMIKSADDGDVRVRSALVREEISDVPNQEKIAPNTGVPNNSEPNVDVPSHVQSAPRQPNALQLILTQPPKEASSQNCDQPEPTTAEVKVTRRVYPPRKPSVHIFYYPWYGSPQFDHGVYYHWDHPVLETPENGTERARHWPPADIASVSYPMLGAYSSRNPDVIGQHFMWMAQVGVNVVSVSWVPQEKAHQRYPWDDLIPSLLDTAYNNDLQVSFHLEPYPGRSALSVRDDIAYLIRVYGTHPAFHRAPTKSALKKLPVFFIYDSYLVPASDWELIALDGGENTIRGTASDAILVGLVLRKHDVAGLRTMGFDGVYTYFAAEGFTEASTMSRWSELANVCDEYELLFIPCVGPGYDDSKVRPWNGANTRSRNEGQYYVKHFQTAIDAPADIIAITSFNEWHEGTQIEPAMPFHMGNYTYVSYDQGPVMYLNITKQMIGKYVNSKRSFFHAHVEQ